MKIISTMTKKEALKIAKELKLMAKDCKDDKLLRIDLIKLFNANIEICTGNLRKPSLSF